MRTSSHADNHVAGGIVDAQDATTKAHYVWEIFRLRAVQAFVLQWTAAVFAYLSMVQLAPTILMQRFGLTVVEAGSCIAMGFSPTVPGMVATGLLESACVARGVSRISIRKRATLVATIATALGHLLFACARSPWQASAALMIYIVGHQFNSSGFFPNLQELGGPDSGALQAVANSCGQLMGSLAPLVGFWLHRKLASWGAINCLSSVVLVVTGFGYCSNLSLTVARDRLPPCNKETNCD
jgi:hypothetical protein